MLPMVVDLRGRSVMVIGAGAVGAHKAAQLVEAGACVTIITSEVLANLNSDVAAVLLRPYQSGDLTGSFLVVAATGDALVNDQIVAEARERNILLNVVDDQERSNFFFTAVHRAGDVMVSISTSGASPALAQWLRNALAQALPKNIALVATQLRAERRAVHARGASTEQFDWTARVLHFIDAALEDPDQFVPRARPAPFASARAPERSPRVRPREPLAGGED